ncbi:MAG: 4-hydroxy-tetrahydrodipicolinate reductase [Elusimicrobiota bacterium]
MTSAWRYSEMIHVGICGAGGRMGQRIIKIVKETPEVALFGLIERPDHEKIGSSVDGVTLTSDISEGISDCDVIIDFSSTGTTLELISECEKKGVSVVIGTTGFDEGQVSLIKEAAKNIPVLLSPNMSIGVNLLFKIVKEITSKLPEYEKEIIEAHHNRKVDAPSGTARKIADIISDEHSKLVYGRDGKPGPRDMSEIGIHAVRAGSIVGEHTIMWAGPDDRIELTHRAGSRGIFASGAVKAAIWLNGQSAGRLYTMEDVLN